MRGMGRWKRRYLGSSPASLSRGSGTRRRAPRLGSLRLPKAAWTRSSLATMGSITLPDVDGVSLGAPAGDPLGVIRGVLGLGLCARRVSGLEMSVCLLLGGAGRRLEEAHEGSAATLDLDASLPPAWSSSLAGMMKPPGRLGGIGEGRFRRETWPCWSIRLGYRSASACLVRGRRWCSQLCADCADRRDDAGAILAAAGA